MNDRHAKRDALGAQLREAREYVGFSKEEVARYLGLPHAVMSGIESGTHQAKEPELRSLAKLYQTSVNFLTGHDQQELQWESFPELYQATTDLVAADRDEVLRFVRFLHSRDSDASK